MDNVNASIHIGVDSSAAMGSLAAMQAKMASLNKSMVSGANASSKAQLAQAAAMGQMLNRSGMWTAAMQNMQTATGRMAAQFDKGTVSSFNEYRKNSKAFSRDHGAINQLAAQRVRALQTQYAALGKEVDGTQRVMKMQPTGMMRQWGAEAMFAQQKAVLFRRNLEMGANSMVNWGKNTQWAGRQMMVGMGIPMALAAAGAVSAFKDIETASISFKRVYGDATTSSAEKAQMLGKIQSGVAQDMTKYGIAVSDTLDVAAKAAATGQQGDDLVTATRETMRLATLGQLDYDQALQSTIATQTAFGVSSKGMTRVTDFLNAAENQTILSMDDMTKAIPRVAPVIRGLGGDVEDLGVLMTALRAGGVTAEQGANALKSGLASLINPTASATTAMKDFGIPLDKIVNANKGDLIGTVQDFGKALKELPKFEQQQALESLFGKYQYARMGALFRNINSKQAKETARLSEESNKNLATMSENELGQIAESALTQFQGAIERLKAAAAPLGEQVLKTLTPMVNGLSGIMGFFANNDAARNVALFGLAFAGLAGVATMVTGVFANFFGTMTKGALLMRRGLDKMMGRSLPRYSSIADLEASAAAKQLGASAEGAAAGLYAEAGAARVLTEALTMLRVEQSAIIANNGRMGPGGAGGILPKPPTTPGSGGPVVTPSSHVVPQSYYTAGEVNRSHFSMPMPIVDKDIQNHLLSQFAPGSKIGDAIRDSEGKFASGLRGLDNRSLFLPSTVNAQMTNNKSISAEQLQGGIKGMGPKMLNPLLWSMGGYGATGYKKLASDPRIQTAAQNIHRDLSAAVMSQPQWNDKSFAPVAQGVVEKHMLGISSEIDKAYAEASKITSIRGAKGGSIELPKGTFSSQTAYSTANSDAMWDAPGGLSAVPALEMLESSAGSAAGSLERLAGAASAAAGAEVKDTAPAGKTTQSGVLTRAQQKEANKTAKDQYLGRSTAAAERANEKARWASLSREQRAEELKQRRAALTNRGAAQGEAAPAQKQGILSRMKASTRMGDPANVSNKLFGLGMAADMVTMGLQATGHDVPGWSHMLGMGMMTMGMFPGLIGKPMKLASAGLGQLGTSLVGRVGGAGAVAAMGKSAGTIGGSFAALAPSLAAAAGPIGAVAAAAVAAAAGFWLINKMSNDLSAAGAQFGDAMTGGNLSLENAASAFGNQTWAQKANQMAAEDAIGSNISEKTMQEAAQALQSEYGQGLLQNISSVKDIGGSGAATKALFQSVMSGVTTGAYSKKQALGLTQAIATQLGDQQLAIDVIAKIKKVVGEGDLKNTADRLSIMADINAEKFNMGDMWKGSADVWAEQGWMGQVASILTGDDGQINILGEQIAAMVSQSGDVVENELGRLDTLLGNGDITAQKYADSVGKVFDIQAKTASLESQRQQIYGKFGAGTAAADGAVNAMEGRFRTITSDQLEGGLGRDAWDTVNQRFSGYADRARSLSSQIQTSMREEVMARAAGNDAAADAAGQRVESLAKEQTQWERLDLTMREAFSSGAVSAETMKDYMFQAGESGEKLAMSLSQADFNKMGNSIDNLPEAGKSAALEAINTGQVKASEVPQLTTQWQKVATLPDNIVKRINFETMGDPKALETLTPMWTKLSAMQKDLNFKVNVSGNVANDPGKLDAMNRGLKTMAGQKSDKQIKVAMSDAGVKNGIKNLNQLNAVRKNLGMRPVTVKVKYSDGGAPNKLAGLRKRVNALPKLSTIKTRAEVEAAAAKVASLKKKVQAATNGKYTVRVNAETGQVEIAKKKVDDTKNAADGGANMNVNVNSDSVTTAQEKVDTLKSTDIGTKTFNVNSNTNSEISAVGTLSNATIADKTYRVTRIESVIKEADGGLIRAFASGGTVNYFPRKNGRISGPGGPRADKIPAMLSDGEFVIKASSVEKYGAGFMDRLNSGTLSSTKVAYLAKGPEGKGKGEKPKSEKDKKSDSDSDKWNYQKDVVNPANKAKNIYSRAVAAIRKIGADRIAVVNKLIEADNPKAFKKFKAMKGDKKKKFIKSILVQERKAAIIDIKSSFAETQKSDALEARGWKNRVKLAQGNKRYAAVALGLSNEEAIMVAAMKKKQRENYLKKKESAAADLRYQEELINFIGMTKGQRNQERTSQLQSLSENERGRGAALGEAAIRNKYKEGSALINARVAQAQLVSDRISHGNDLEQRKIDDINDAYDEQAKILDKVQAAQQGLANIEKARLGVAGSLSSGDVAGAAAAMQEAKQTQAQFAQEQMRAGLDAEREARIKEHQDIIDTNQDKIDAISDFLWEINQGMAETQAEAALNAELIADEYERQNTILQTTRGYWADIAADIERSQANLKDVIRNNPAPAAPGPAGAVTDTANGGRWNSFMSKFKDLNKKEQSDVISSAFKGKGPKARENMFSTWSDKKQKRLIEIISDKKISNAEEKEMAKFAKGGWVGGYGSGDKIPAMLTPGEFVVNKLSAQKFGGALENLNSPSFRFASAPGMATAGGGVGYNGGNTYTLTFNMSNTNADVNQLADMVVRKIDSVDSRAIRKRGW